MTQSGYEPPEGFEVFHSSPFLAAIGPIWISPNESPPIFGVRIEARHTNTAGTAHGAMLVALADVALGHGIRALAGSAMPLVTAGLTVDFASPVRIGEWVQAQADVQHQSRRNVFANCYLFSGANRVVRVSGINTIMVDESALDSRDVPPDTEPAVDSDNDRHRER
jgi:acyl-coenzyme A thioesterase 13